MSQKKVFALAVLASASMAAMAQAPTSSVTMYGIVDAGVTNTSGVRGGSVKQLVSGIMDGSRLGVRGNEDLGGGYRALFTAEMRIELDNGSVNSRPISGSQLPDRVSQAALLGLPAQLQPVVSAVAGNIGSTVGVNLAGNIWDRQIFAGLVTPFGGFLAGRQYTPAYEISANFDALGTQSALAVGQIASLPGAFDIRLSNSVQYRIVQGGLSASLMMAAGEGSASTGRFWGGMAMYRAKDWSVGLGYNTRENERGAKSLTGLVMGATLNLGPGRLSGMYAQIEDDNPTGLSGLTAQLTPQVGAATAALVAGRFVEGFKQDGVLWQIGYKATFGPNTFYVAYNSYDDKRPNNADVKSYGVTYTYELSKRTDINAYAVRFVNSRLAQAAPGNAGYLGGVTTSAGTDSTGLGLGIRHRF